MRKYWKWAKADYQAGGIRRLIIVALGFNLLTLVAIYVAIFIQHIR